MEEQKYLYANIKIPIILKNDGSIEPLKDYIQVDFSRCNELPLKQNTDVNYSFVINNLKNFLNMENVIERNEEDDDNKINKEINNEIKDEPDNKNDEIKEKKMILKSEIKNIIKNKINTSFKINNKPNNRYTVKTRTNVNL